MKTTVIRKASLKGFLLPDVMIAVFVSTVAIVAILAALAPTLRGEFYKRDEIIATGLAQEGIELVRNVRDNNWKTCAVSGETPCSAYKTAFEAPFPDPSSSSLCIDSSMDFLATGFNSSQITCAQSGGDILSTDDFGKYTYSGGSKASKFKREIIVSGSGTDKRSVTSTVTWDSGGSSHEVSISNTLYDWGDK